MNEIFKLARPMMNGVKLDLNNNHGLCDVKNNMVKDILTGLPAFVGEIVVGRPEAEDCTEVTQEFLDDEFMLQLFVFWVYDLRTTNNYDLKSRLEMAQSFTITCGPNVQYVDHELIQSTKDLMLYRDKVISKGFEGIILREPYSTFGTQDEEITAETAIV